MIEGLQSDRSGQGKASTSSRRDLRRLHLLLGSAIAVALSGPAFAQQPASGAQAESADAATIEDIIVTAQKREERLQEVPISVAVVTSTTIAARNLIQLTDLGRLSPGVQVTTGGRSDRLSIRGVSSAPGASIEQSVGTFVDGIYRGRSRTSSAGFLDLERIEILKGPQGTLFGNNAIAGAFNIITAKPTAQPSGFVRGVYGTEGEYTVEAAGGGAVTSNLLARGAIIASGSSGYISDSGMGRKIPAYDNLAGRGTLLFEPSADFNATLKVEVGRSKQKGGIPNEAVGCPPNPVDFPAGPGRFCQAALANGQTDGVDYRRATSPGQSFLLRNRDVVLTLNKMIGDGELTSITGYSWYRYNANIDVDGVPQVLLHIAQPERYRQISEELRYTSAKGNFLEYSVGLYYQNGKLDSDFQNTYGFLATAIATAAPSLAALLPFNITTKFRQKDETFSAFGLIGINPTDRLTISLGGRWSSVKKDFRQANIFGRSTDNYGQMMPYSDALQSVAQAAAAAVRLSGQNFYGVAGVPAYVLSRKDTKFTPSLNVNYKVDDRVMLYASVAKGFKSGGFNAADVSRTAANVLFAPETVTAYEIGIKSELFDRRLLLNLDAFRSNYKNQQQRISINNGPTLVSLIRNAASTVAQGVELESQLVVTDQLKVMLSGLYLDTHFKSYPNGGATSAQLVRNPLAIQDLSDRSPPYAPEWSGNAGFIFTAPVGDFKLTVDGNVFFSSKYFLEETLDPNLVQQGFARIDGRVALATFDNAWELSVIGRNLNKKKTYIFGAVTPSTPGTYGITPERPRSVAVQLRYKW
ncbi:TonB-dependent receptor [Sphingomonas sp. Root1294]|nr:TonB-dependent receptor [Sphingomonas sp. Root1294]KQX19116.1 hypothetical protein ASD17_11145 [Sphingomonas sp. Root1294]KQY65317.1 hypothetical protein ASD39_14340 [Sphingomonas sp. Root50]KRB95388.1 hypothetical protein ASE22_05715 [Sphingomonas sp. Root720]